MDYKVYVAFGFHVNCYHSYRGDSNDAFGFGNDIKIIRDEIKVLDEFNKDGVDVKGTWDFENAYSLEKILPEYAKDIISDVKRRTIENDDENILMGYDNGAMSAMSDAEFKANIDKALNNEKKSGLIDCFTMARKIIRPQEVMFSPAQMDIYKQCGIEALCLYNCCVPFDAMRSIIKPMSEEMMYNYVTYKYEDKTLTVLPTYCQSDLMDIGSLSLLALRLHKLQQVGSIKNDCFIFINIDADSFLWEPLPVPNFMKKWPNMGGLKGLIEEVKDYDFVKFTTPGKYLDTHKPVGEITFGHDVADGNFTGYSSWSEKPFNRMIWTRLERARLRSQLKGKEEESESFNDRISLLSTTHFGLASPVLNIDREKAALDISSRCNKEDRILEKETTLKDSITIHTLNNDSLINVQLTLKEGMYKDVQEIILSSNTISSYTIFKIDEYEDKSIKTINLLALAKSKEKEHLLSFSKGESKTQENMYKNYDVIYDQDLKKIKISYKKKTLALLSSYIKYDKKIYNFTTPEESQLPLSGTGNGITYKGEIHLPNEIKGGSYEFSFITVDYLDGVILLSKVNYPYTSEADAISSNASSLGRFSDKRWDSVVPYELSFTLNEKAVLKKRAFNQKFSEYPLSSFKDADKENIHIDSINQQLSGGYLEIEDDASGIILSHSRQLSGSMAHNPISLTYADNSFEVKVNPYGHYFGKQRHYPSECGGLITTTYNLTMPQATSLAPSYNGAKETTLQLIASKESKITLDEIISFADGAIASYSEKGNITSDESDHVETHPYIKQNNQHLKKTHSNGNTLLLIKTMLKLLSHISKTRKKVKKLEKELTV